MLHTGLFLILSYPVLVDIGLLLGALLTYLEARRRKLPMMHVLDAALAAAVAGLILAHAVHVGLHWDYYTNHLSQALRLRDGGLAWQGALVGGTAGAAIMCAIRTKPLAATLDVLTSGAASVALFSWLACLVVGCAHGIPSFPEQGLLWSLSLDLPDLYGIREPRVAVQLLGAGWSVLVMGATLVAQRRAQQRGMVLALWLTLHSLGSFALGFLRGDEMPLIDGWPADQVANLALATAGVGTMFLTGRHSGPEADIGRRKPNKEATR